MEINTHTLPSSTPTPSTYPVSLSGMHGAPVVVVGGGQVGERKIRGLLAVRAAVRLISPVVTPHLHTLAEAGELDWEQRLYAQGDIANDAGGRPVLVFAVTSVREVNAQVAREAAALGILCNVVDAPDEGTFHVPAVYREAGLVVAVSTEGVSPSRSRQVRDRIAQVLEEQ